MAPPILPISPVEATKLLLKSAPSRRMRDIVEKRFGLSGKRRVTLEAIGREYRITRERVRQIEADALRHLQREESGEPLKPVFQAIESHLKNHGEVMAETHLFSTVADPRASPHLAFLLEVGNPFRLLPETGAFSPRWTTNPELAAQVEEALARTCRELERRSRTVSRQELESLLARYLRTLLGTNPKPQAIAAYLATSKVIRPNPFGEYGLASWPQINPRGVRDRAYVVLARAGKPMHFREVADAITRVAWSKKRAHVQTVHNELIKDSRFVLVGRGLYGLGEWGYTPGVVKDVLVSILKAAKAPLARDEIVRLTMEKRLVKPQTILLNLQNKTIFKRTEDGRYILG